MAKNRKPWSTVFVPDKCANCGTTENLHFHHIVPLGSGGNDIETNVVVLCETCHGKAHNRNLFSNSGAEFKGRPQKYKLTKEAIHTLNAWVDHKIGTIECKQDLGIDTATHIVDTALWKEYRRQGYGANYVPHSNGLDVSTAKKTRGKERRFGK